jgi:hypothetical protein
LPILYLIVGSICFLMGSYWLSFLLVFLIAASVMFDSILPFDKASHDRGADTLLNFLLYATIPGVYAAIICFNIAMTRADASMGIGKIIVAYIAIGLLISSIGTTVAHELVHRVGNPKAVIAGRWLLAPTLDTSFSIEHVYGHHAHVATRRDPASARYGESVYAFFLRSTYGSILSAWNFEAQRLAKRGHKSAFTLSNRVVSGQLMSLCVMAIFIAFQGPWGVLSFVLVAVTGKFILEAINYIEHYGLVREEGKPVEIRHSWNCNHSFSTRFLFNLTRHSHHHAKGFLPFWKLQSQEAAPNFPHGYMAMLLLALFPPLFRRTLNAPLKNWVESFATENEKKLALR